MNKPPALEITENLRPTQWWSKNRLHPGEENGGSSEVPEICANDPESSQGTNLHGAEGTNVFKYFESYSMLSSSLGILRGWYSMTRYPF